MSGCRVDFLNVGFGGCVVIYIKREKEPFVIVIDGGDLDEGYYKQHIERITLEEYLEECGVKTIDLWIMTHYHKDHIAGSLPCFDKVKINEVITNFVLPESLMNISFGKITTPAEASVEIYQKILTKVSEKQIPLKVLDATRSIQIGEYSVHLYRAKEENIKDILTLFKKLEPDPHDFNIILDQIDQRLNSTALAVGLTKNNKNLLVYTSDVPKSFWEGREELLKEVGIMSAPHHGDTAYLSEELLQKANPKDVIISADSCNTYNLPSREITCFIKKNCQARIHYTEVQGARDQEGEKHNKFISFNM